MSKTFDNASKASDVLIDPTDLREMRELFKVNGLRAGYGLAMDLQLESMCDHESVKGQMSLIGSGSLALVKHG